MGNAIQFSAADGVPITADAAGTAPDQGNTLIKPKWTGDVPIYVRGMVLGGQKLFIVGPPDIIDEEATFQQLTEKDPEVQKLLDHSDQVMDGKDGGFAPVGQYRHRGNRKSLEDGIAPHLGLDWRGE